MSFIDPTDPMGFFLWQEFLERDPKYECPECGTLFGAESVAWSDEHGCMVFECPGCGCSGVVQA